MSCGHVLRSRLRDYGTGAQCKGERWRPAFINDSCAACHRPLNYNQNRVLHEAEHATLMTGYMRAKSSGDEEGMRRLRRAMLEHTRSSRQRNFATSLVREERYGDVLWPGASSGGGAHAPENEENGP
ncbi:hypothetical protein LZ31DRAFT_527761 [Colletotrichum somersetense]|nr:hypothetical protein LZ31DRAFT_527761 [Colletotrichum somersetense]